MFLARQATWGLALLGIVLLVNDPLAPTWHRGANDEDFAAAWSVSELAEMMPRVNPFLPLNIHLTPPPTLLLSRIL